jgi:hypothetical protein
MESQLLLFGDGIAKAAPPGDSLAEAFRRLATDLTPTILYTSARRRIFSWKDDPAAGTITVRVGSEFRAAPRPVAEALVRIVTRHRLPRATRKELFFRIRCWLTSLAPCGPVNDRCLPPRGRHVDLAPVLAAVRARDFDEPLHVNIGWTERPARNLMGRYERSASGGLIAINRLLDSPLTPTWYLDFLVFHEMLHAVIPPRPGASRILVHPPEFRIRERQHPSHGGAAPFERWASGPGFRMLLEPRRLGARLPRRFR